MIWTLSQIALGGAIGACLRHLAVLGALRALGPGFPYGTLAVNVLGCFCMGLFFVILSTRGNILSPFLLTGVLGGFTTFSAFSLDALRLWEAGNLAQAALYIAASLLLSLAALVLGAAIARSLT